MQKVSVLFWLNRSKNNNGKAPIYCRITVDGKRAPELSTGKFLETTVDKEGNVKCKRWDYEAEKNGKKILTNDQKVLGSQEDAILINRHLASMRNSIDKIIQTLEANGEMVSAAKVNSMLTGSGSNKHTLIECYKEHLKRMEELIGNGFTKTTHEQAVCRMGSLEIFVKEFYKTEDVYLSQVNREFIENFSHWGRTKTGFYPQSKIKIKPWNHNTSVKHLACLKTITDQCLAKKWIKDDPFQGMNLVYDKPKFKFLTEEELALIEETEIELERLSVIKDVFLFCCYTSLEYSAVYALTEDNIVKGINGQISVMRDRNKTENTAYIPLLDKAKAILKKYEDNPYCLSTGKLLPVKSNSTYNQYIKEVAKLCGIKKNLTTHVARHTAATFLLNNEVSEVSVCDIMGLSSTKVLRSTYGKLLRKTVHKEITKLQERLSGTV
jgi:integrase